MQGQTKKEIKNLLWEFHYSQPKVALNYTKEEQPINTIDKRIINDLLLGIIEFDEKNVL